MAQSRSIPVTEAQWYYNILIINLVEAIPFLLSSTAEQPLRQFDPIRDVSFHQMTMIP